jgi:photosystem II stability/assembly factor-like uncharacterized protein
MRVGHINLYRTEDGGSRWEKVAGKGTSTHEDQQSVIFDHNDSKYVYLSNDGGVFRSMILWPRKASVQFRQKQLQAAMHRVRKKKVGTILLWDISEHFN